MDPRNYTITNLQQKKRRINPDSATDDLNEIDVDFDVQLGDDKKGNPMFIKVNGQQSLESVKIIKMDYLKDSQDIVELDDLVCKEFSGKSNFRFIFSLNDIHKYRYEVKLDKGKTLTYRRMFKIICQSAKKVLEDTLKFVGGSSKKDRSPNIIGDESDHDSEDDVPTENNENKDSTNGGFFNSLYKLIGGSQSFSVDEKLNKLEVLSIGVQKKGNRIFVEFSGFDEY
jgi:hypothetical protein